MILERVQPTVRLLIGSPISQAEWTFLSHTLLWVGFGLALSRVLGL